MSILEPEYEYVDRSNRSIRYLEHGWPTELCRWHSHAEYELHLLLKTRGTAYVGDYIGAFKPGSLFLVGPNLPHNWVTDHNAQQSPSIPIRDMLVQFDHSSFAQLSQAFPEFKSMQKMMDLARSGIEFVDFNPTFAKGHFESIRDSQGAERIVAFLRFLVRLNEHAQKKALSIVDLSQHEGNHKHARIGHIVDYVIKHYDKPISVERAADISGMSTSAFSRNFRAVTGNKFIEFITRVRVDQACNRLLATDDPVSSICYDVGFQNLANFNRHFLRLKKMSPRTFREHVRQELSPLQRPLS